MKKRNRGRRRLRSGAGSKFCGENEASRGDREVDSLLLPPPDYASCFLWVSLPHSLPFLRIKKIYNFIFV